MAEIKKINTEFQLLDKFLDTSGDAGTSGQVLSSTASGVNWVSGSGLPGGPYLPLAGGTLSGNLTITKSSAMMKVSEAGGGDIRMVAGGSTGYVGTYNNTSMQILQNGSNAIFIDTSKNIGIGVTSPSIVGGTAKLTVNVGSGTSSPVSIVNGTTDGMYIRRYAVNGQYQIQTTSGSGNSGNLSLQSYGGNVGIGTTSPSRPLSVYRSTAGSAANFLHYTDATAFAGLYIDVDNVNNIVELNASGDTASTMAFQTGNAERMRITTTGNVGIGTTSPGHKLSVIGGHIQTDGNVYTNVIRDNTGGNVSIQDNGGNVGIGTTSPNHKLDVNGGAQFNTDTGATPFYITRLGGTSQALSIKVMDDNVRFESIQDETADDYGGFDFRMDGGTTEPDFVVRKNAGNPILNVKGNGNVGIGTTSPTSKLFITAADGEMVDTYMVNILNQELTAGDNFGVQIRAGLNTSDVSLNVANKDGSSLFRVRGDGNVGIGTTSPGNKLSIQGSQATVYNSTDSGGQAFAGTTINNTNTAGNTNNFSQLLFTVGTNNNSVSRIVAIRSGSDASDLAFVGESAAGVAEYMRIKSGGNVGIGTTSPTYKLEVDDSANASNNYITTVSNNSNNSGILFKDASGNRGLVFANPDNDLVFMSGGTSEKMRVTSSGNVGIGTTSPGVKLDVNGQIRSNNEFLLQTGTTAIGSIRNQAGALDIRGDSTRDVSLGSVTSPQALFIEGSNGNVGIGTTSPNAKLNVNGNIKIEGTNSLSFGGSASIPSWAINSSGNDLIINDQATTSGDVLFTNDGSVGIGTTSPSQKLDVNGVVQSDRFFVGTNTAPSQWAVQVRNNNSTADSGIYFNNNSSEIYLRNSSNVIGARIRSNSASYFNGGDVGIGTASPQERLHVSGETHPSIKLSSSSDGNYNVILNCGYRNEALNLSVGGYKVFTTEGFNTPETTHLYSNNSKALSLASNQAATFTSTVTATNFINSSDERLKENIEEVRDNNVEVNWKTFNFKTEKEQKRYGVIAQELEKTNPEFVREDSQGFKSVAYIDLLIAKIAELEARIQKLEK